MGEVSMLECQFMLKFRRKKIVHVKCGRSEEEMKKSIICCTLLVLVISCFEHKFV